MSTLFDTPFIVPVAGCFMILGLGASGIYSDMRSKELRSQERLAMVARGIPLAEIEATIGSIDKETKPTRDPFRSLTNTRRAATVLMSVGVALVIFGLMLDGILHLQPVLVVSAVGVINLVIGLGFLVDYRMQTRELARFGMEVNTDTVSMERSGR